MPIAGGAKDFPGASGCRGSPGPPAAGAAKGRRRHPPPKRRPAAGLFFRFPRFGGGGGCGFCFFNPSGVFFVPSPECFVRLSPHGAKAAYGPGRGAPDRGGPGPVRTRSPARDAKKAPRRLFRVPGPGPEMNTRGYRQRPAPVAARPGAPADPRGPGPGPHNGPAHALWFFFFLGVLPGSIAFPVLASPPPPSSPPVPSSLPSSPVIPLVEGAPVSFNKDAAFPGRLDTCFSPIEGGTQTTGGAPEAKVGHATRGWARVTAHQPVLFPPSHP